LETRTNFRDVRKAAFCFWQAFPPFQTGLVTGGGRAIFLAREHHRSPAALAKMVF
jgi:hypothetical protein